MEKITYTNVRGESIVFDGPPFYLVSVNGLGDVGANVQRKKAPYQDGSSRIGSTLDERVIPIEFLIVGDDYAEVSERRIQMSRILNPKLDEGTLRYENDYVVREISVSAESVPFFPDGSGNRITEMQKGLVTLVASDPYWKSTTIVEEPMAAFVELFEFPSDYWELDADGDIYFEMGIEGERRHFTIDGDSEVPIQITFNGPSTNPVIHNLTTNEFIKVNRTLNQGDVLFIDTENATVEINGVNAFNWIDLGSTFWKLQIGENIVEYTADDGAADAELVIKWQERYTAV